MLVICKHWNWNWHWDWKYYIFLTKGGDIVWWQNRPIYVTFWSRDKCKASYLPFRNIYGHQTWQCGNAPSEDPHITSQVTFWSRGWSRDKFKKLVSVLPQYLWPPHLAEWYGWKIPFKWPFDNVVMWQGRRTQPTKSCDRSITWSREELKIYQQSRDLGWKTPSGTSRERLTKWLRGHYLLNVFKASVAIILKIWSLLSAVLHFLDDKIILILSHLSFRSSPP